MEARDRKADLQRYLGQAREVMVWKLDGLSEYDRRRPVVPSGTNLLGLVKHLAGVEAGYFGSVFDRPFPEPLPWEGNEDDPNVDMWATPEETTEDIVGLYRRVQRHADETIDAVALDEVHVVPWWPAGRQEITLHRALVHVIAETHRHAGHADVLRELIDGALGLRPGVSNLAQLDGDAWAAYRDTVERAARRAGGL